MKRTSKSAQASRVKKQNASGAGQEKYDHKGVEKKWQDVWTKIRLDETNISRSNKPFYNLMMFPYPSAEGLHVGNMYAFTGSDMYGRFKRMQGYNVFEPIGLDGFGIHSENYALKIGRHPMEHAKVTEKNFYHQLRTIGAMFDWSRTVETYDPDYYRWTQWLFVQMFKNGLAYRGKANVNWCPGCKTVLADEQVIDGKCERCGNIAEKRLLEQWFFRITAYAEKLLQNSFSLDWSEKVRVAQQNWIGKKEGINISYDVVDEKGNKQGVLECFTTRPDTNFGATFVVIAPEHPFISQIQEALDSKQSVRIVQYVNDAKKKSETDRIAEGRKKTGVFTGLYCINSLNNTKMPLYVSDFVVMGFGTGAVVGVPGHDKRDFEFAQAFDLPIIRVVIGKDTDTSAITRIEQVQEEEGAMVNSQFLDGMEIHAAKDKIMDYIEEKGWGKRVTTYHLRDWLISRQRYWGPPIPMIYCEACAKQGKSWFTSDEAALVANEHLDPSSVSSSNSPSAPSLRESEAGQNAVGSPQPSSIGNWKLEIGNSARSAAGWYPVPEDQLPVELPYIDDYKPGNDGVAPLAKHKEFYETSCPGCGGKAVRETDVSDTFLDSSWYFLRYSSVGSATQKTHAFDPEITKKWLPVHMYTGGAEHSVLHLMYSRFITMALHDWGHIDFEEPFAKFFAHGLVIKDGAKMSKSKGNVVNPDEYIERYSADALRLYLMFMGPFSQGGDFRDSAMEGMSRWVGRIWRIAMASLGAPGESTDGVKRALGKLVGKVSEDLEKRHYNTAIASMMEWTNLVGDEGGVVGKEELKTCILLLAPFAPHLAEELWSRFSGVQAPKTEARQSVHVQPWPSYETRSVADEAIEVIVQVNGKLRDKLKIQSSTSKAQSEVEKLVQESEKMQKFLAGQSVKKVIFVPGKLINFVV